MSNSPMSEYTPPARLVTFLGTGNYQVARYHWRGQTVETKFFARAAAEIARPSEVVLVATPEAEAQHGAALREQIAELDIPTRTADITYGQDEQELWRLFEVVSKLLDAPGSVLLDVTHGFRSQPLFTLAAAAFHQFVAEQPAPLEIVYGAWEAKNPDTGITPVYDLTLAVELLRWSADLHLLLSTGRAKGVADRTEEIGRLLRRQWAQSDRQTPAPQLTRLADALRAFGDDFETARVGDLLLGSSAGRLAELIPPTREEVARHLPPLAKALDRIAEMTAGLHAETFTQPAGHAALARLARLYFELGRYTEAAAVLREAHICRYAEQPTAADARRGGPFSGKLRAEAETRWKEVAGYENEIGNLRNDLNHAGFNDQPRQPEKVRQQLDALIAKLEALAADEASSSAAAVGEEPAP